LLKKGDTWTNEAFGYLGVSGKSATEPMLFSSYGSGPRPLIKTLPSNSEAGIGSGSRRGPGNFVAVVGLEFYAHTRDPASPTFNYGTLSSEHRGFFFLSPYDWILIEDCKFSFYDGNAVQTAASTTNTFRMRRNVVTDSYSTSGHSVGIYIEGCGNPYFEQNLWDNNGWNAKVPGAPQTIFSRNVYIEQSCGPVIATEEMSFNSASEGCQYRTGGTITNSLFVANSNGFDLGHQLDGDRAPAIHVAAVTNNVIMASRDIPGYGPRNQGIVMLQCKSEGAGVRVNNNIVANIGAGGDDGSAGILIDRNSSNCDVTGNIIFNWTTGKGNVGIRDNGTNNTTSPNVVDMPGANNQRAPQPFLAPKRTVGGYYGSIGGSPATTAGFLAAARLQSKNNWNPALLAGAVNNYIRAGFGR